jgi:putative hydrolase of the HAD superfamily
MDLHARHGRVPQVATWLLCDYGEVLSLPPTREDWRRVAGAAGWDPDDPDGFDAAYWSKRMAYDRADLTAADYWATVVGRPLGPDELDRVTAADAAMWLRPNPATLAAARRAGDRGLRLAILSNAPFEVAEAVGAAGWLAPFSPKLFSCDLRSAKPERAIYQAALSRLGAQPDQVTFFDDRPENVAGAARLGIDARHFEAPGQLDEVSTGRTALTDPG